ncbi:hypothetical protein Bca52824_024731 [Brassica carinata]|uniref:Uncharacterized protein n=1 Tax=Brassica carinata TaxID=52824 RepID=A0A8X7VL32_BRACI|nr:hypothetical protein Bca52824_024731 [Brassica carinata]
MANGLSRARLAHPPSRDRFHAGLGGLDRAERGLEEGVAWGSLGIFPASREALPSLMGLALLSNLGASVTEVAKDALVAEYGLRYHMNGLKSYALMASAVGGVLGNLLGGYCLLKTPPRILFLAFTAILSLQLTVSLSSKEESFGLARIRETSFKKHFSDLMGVIQLNNRHRCIFSITPASKVSHGRQHQFPKKEIRIPTNPSRRSRDWSSPSRKSEDTSHQSTGHERRVRRRQRRPLTVITNAVIDEPPERRSSHRKPPHQSPHRYTEIERNATNNTESHMFGHVAQVPKERGESETP